MKNAGGTKPPQCTQEREQAVSVKLGESKPAEPTPAATSESQGGGVTAQLRTPPPDSSPKCSRYVRHQCGSRASRSARRR